MKKTSYKSEVLKFKMFSRTKSGKVLDINDVLQISPFFHSKNVLRSMRSLYVDHLYSLNYTCFHYVLRSDNFEHAVKAITRLKNDTHFFRLSNNSYSKKACFLTGRNRGVFEVFGLSRIVLRKAINSGRFMGFAKKV